MEQEEVKEKETEAETEIDIVEEELQLIEKEKQVNSYFIQIINGFSLFQYNSFLSFSFIFLHLDDGGKG